ncbi:beta-glucosidase 1 [Lineolata rhizophorae]|uniref:beta-glucosidase n=1 Tax=Lineolata rhizophorae TaxID=578093 RepID=A0A6A6NVT9_9PEZI|nr:beta-glucosidase 1 [Lineolata rhizophorae]
MWLTQALATCVAVAARVQLAAAQASSSADAASTNSSGRPGAEFGQTSPPFYPSPWMDGSGTWGEAYEKAQDFVSQMTLLEKVNLTTGVGWMSEGCVGNVGSVPRLGLHSLCLEDGPLGIRSTDYNSAFPAGGTVGASWDRGVWYERGYQMGMEFRGKGIDIQLGPAIGPLGRMPEGGRNWEGFSPDPYLSGVAVAQTVKGIQDAGVIATTKHYIMNEQEHFRQAPEAVDYGYNISESLSSNIDDTTLHETYLWPFADAVRAGTGAIMCSYNQINNSYGCQNSHLMNYILKGELGFQGFVMSDWQAQHSGVGSALAGLDMSMPGDTLFNTGNTFWGTNLTLSVLNGTVPEWRLDDMATRIMAAYYFVGRDRTSIPANFNAWTLDTMGFEHPAAEADYGLVNQHVDVRANHARTIREHAARSTVLMKNSGVLPLSGEEKFTAVFGDNAGANPKGPNGCDDRGCDNGTLAMAWGSGTANFPYLVTPLTAIQNEVLGNGGIIQGMTDNFAYDEMTALASQSSVSIVFVSADSGEGFISVDGNEGDRKNLTLWQGGEEMIDTVTSQCNNTIVVIQSTGPVLLGSFNDNPNVTALLWMGLAGEQAGNSIADVLYGRVNPGGKLPFTFGAERSDWGTNVLYEPNNGLGAPQQQFTEGNFIDYRAFDRAGIDPTYEFGFGLSYTTFEYSDLTVTKHDVGPYAPTTGETAPAPVLGNDSDTDPADLVFPDDIRRLPLYIYPYLNSTDLEASSGEEEYGTADEDAYIPPGARDGGAQPRIPAGGAPGGNPLLYDVMFTVRATVSNTGPRVGEEVPQLYVSLGGDAPPRVLRGFDRLSIQPGRSATFVADLTRRDVSNWDTVSQNWVITDAPKTVFVGPSSRDLPLSQELDVSV